MAGNNKKIDGAKQAETDSSSFSNDPVGAPSRSCPLASEDNAYWVELTVATRLGDIPINGVKVKVAGEDWGPTDENGGYRQGEKPKRKRMTSPNLTIQATYANEQEKLKKEEFKLKLASICPDSKKHKGKVEQKIAKVEDFKGQGADADFFRTYPLDNPHTRGEVRWASGNTDTKNEPILRITVHLATFSLYVRYLSQNYQRDTLNISPGNDPEAVAHAVVRTPDSKKWRGSVLCSPTCATMLADYWNRHKGESGIEKSGVLDRTTVLQRCYDLWAKKGFPDRPGKRAIKSSEEPSFEHKHGQYWLRTAEMPYEMYRREFRYQLTMLDAVQEMVQRAGGVQPPIRGGEVHYCAEPPIYSFPGDLWTPDLEVVYEITANQWKFIPEGRWRVLMHGAEVWKFAKAVAETAASFGPEPGKWGHGFSQKFHIDNAKLENSTRRRRLLRRSVYRRRVTAKQLPLSRPVDEETGVGFVKTRRDTKITYRYPLTEAKGVLDDYKRYLSKGWPFSVSCNATGGHIILIRGALVNEEGDIEWLIVNDPYGNLASPEKVVMDDFDIKRSVGRNTPNLPDDVEVVQQALQDNGYYDGEIDGECDGTKEDPVVQGIKAFQKSIYKKGARPSGTISPKMKYTTKKLGVKIGHAVGRDKNPATNDPDDVEQVQEILNALGFYEPEEASGICDDELVLAIIAFEKKHIKRRRDRTGGVIHNSDINRRRGKRKQKIWPHEKILKRKLTRAKGYKSNAMNDHGKKTGDAATKGQHTYYRNTTPGKNNNLRIKEGTCARVEVSMTKAQISENLTPGA